MMNHSLAARPEGKTLRRVQAKSRKIAWNIVRYLLVFGIAFIILYPLLVKLSVSLMSEADLLAFANKLKEHKGYGGKDGTERHE